MMIYQIHPDHGWHIAYGTTEADYNNKHGWKTVTEAQFYDRPKKPAASSAINQESPVSETGEESHETADEERETAVNAYVLKFGKKPHHKLGTANILKALDDNGE